MCRMPRTQSNFGLARLPCSNLCAAPVHWDEGGALTETARLIQVSRARSPTFVRVSLGPLTACVLCTVGLSEHAFRPRIPSPSPSRFAEGDRGSFAEGADGGTCKPRPGCPTPVVGAGRCFTALGLVRGCTTRPLQRIWDHTPQGGWALPCPASHGLGRTSKARESPLEEPQWRRRRRPGPIRRGGARKGRDRSRGLSTRPLWGPDGWPRQEARNVCRGRWAPIHPGHRTMGTTASSLLPQTGRRPSPRGCRT